MTMLQCKKSLQCAHCSSTISLVITKRLDAAYLHKESYLTKTPSFAAIDEKTMMGAFPVEHRNERCVQNTRRLNEKLSGVAI